MACLLPSSEQIPQQSVPGLWTTVHMYEVFEEIQANLHSSGEKPPPGLESTTVPIPSATLFVSS